MNHHHPHADREPWQNLPEGFADRLATESHLNETLRQDIFEHLTRVIDTPPVMIIDVGSGTGADSVALAQQFPEANIHALDISVELLERVASAASAADLEHRISVHETDVSDDWAQAIQESVDLAWASLSLHHLREPLTALRHVFAALRNSGLCVLTEMSEPGNHRSHDWSKLLEQAGFTIVEQWEQVAKTTHPDHPSRDGRSVWIARRPAH